jgi:hypothetical protein
MVYIAADQPLPLIAWDAAAPALHISELRESHQPVRQQFSKPLVYYVGSHEGCGCGFDYREWEIDDPARETIERLASYLAVAVQRGSVELFACWDGDQQAELVERNSVTPAYFGGEAFAFNELELLTVERENERKEIHCES